MLKLLSDELNVNDVGGKAASLSKLTRAGFDVPKGYVLTADVWRQMLAEANVAEAFAELLAADMDIEQKSQALLSLSDRLRLPDQILARLRSCIVVGQSYAVRSSGLLEDTQDSSFAGQYHTELNVCGLEAIVEAIMQSYRSMLQTNILAYLVHHKLKAGELSMCVIIQEMIHSEVSGVVFTLDPVSGADSVAVAELAPGYGDALVNGQVVPSVYRFDWHEQRWLQKPDPKPLSDAEPKDGSQQASTGLLSGAQPADDMRSAGDVQPADDMRLAGDVRSAGDVQTTIGARPASAGLLSDLRIREMFAVTQDIQILYGQPCDIELAFDSDGLHILQARPITHLEYQGYADLWTTADFRDGGVSAEVCKPLMWGLYDYAWRESLGDFLREGKLISASSLEGRELGHMYYGRPYWNLSIVKEVMAAVPGYREREFDSEYGITPTYAGDGQVTKVTLAKLPALIRVVLIQSRMLRQRRLKAEALKRELVEIWCGYEQHILAFECADTGEHQELIDGRTLWQGDAKSKRSDTDGDTDGLRELQLLCLRLTKEHYLQSESTYFVQIFINTIHQALFKDDILRYVDKSGYLALIGGLDDISHLRPFYRMWEITQRIRASADDMAFWQAGIGSVYEALQRGASEHGLADVSAWIAEFGYHSRKELDISCADYAEEPLEVLKMFADTLALDEEMSPDAHRQRQKQAYEQQLAALSEKVGNFKFGKLRKKIEKMRKLLWWREEFRDVSTRFYHLIRRYMLALAHEYHAAGIFERSDDIWFLSLEELWCHIEGRQSDEQLRECVAKNRRYYMSYRNYRSRDEIGRDQGVRVGDGTDGGKRDGAVGHATGAQLGGIDPEADLRALSGLGCSAGVIRGVARVVEGLDDIGRLEKGDILVTRFTDTGWTSKFAILGGVITEYGGILCHAAIVSREYGLPCAVCVHEAMSKIEDGAEIILDGSSGRVELL